ncbi:hypothetical protein LINPERPRIM_LOCUS4654 [Linum perenne]
MSSRISRRLLRLATGTTTTTSLLSPTLLHMATARVTSTSVAATVPRVSWRRRWR